MSCAARIAAVLVGWGVLLLALPIQANPDQADPCVGVLEKSKLKHRTVSGRDDIENAASEFCGEYSKSSGQRDSKKFNVAYEKITAGYGSTDASYDAVASKYCDRKNIEKRSTEAYSSYLETMAPEAYGAYEQCLRFRSMNAVQFEVAALDATWMSLRVSYRDNGSAMLRVTADSVAGVTCAWTGGAAVVDGVVTLKSGVVLANLGCRRNDAKRKTTVSISRTDLPGASFDLPWPSEEVDREPVRRDGFCGATELTTGDLGGWSQIGGVCTRKAACGNAAHICSSGEIAAYLGVGKTFSAEVLGEIMTGGAWIATGAYSAYFIDPTRGGAFAGRARGAYEFSDCRGWTENRSDIKVPKTDKEEEVNKYFMGIVLRASGTRDSPRFSVEESGCNHKHIALCCR